MTIDEAIKRLKEARSTIQPFRYVDEAIDYAIKALEHYELSGRQIERSYEMEYTDGYNQGWKDGRKALEQQPCEDSISRTEALERIEVRRKITCESDPYNYEEWTKGYEEGIDDAIAMINSVPSVTPSYNSIKTELKSCEDCISREEALKVMCDKCPMYNCVTRCSSYRHIEKMPSVTPQKKVGRWITWEEAGNEIPSETRFECSVCHDAAQTLCNGLDLLSLYCPNCGAKMVEE